MKRTLLSTLTLSVLAAFAHAGDTPSATAQTGAPISGITAIGAPSAQAASEQSRLIGQVMRLLEKSFGEAFDADSVNAARFAVHLRYFLVRARTTVQIEDGTSSLVAEALRISDRTYVLETGEVTVQGPSAELLDDPQLRSAYLGLD